MTYVLDKEGVHARLIQDMEHICTVAGVPAKCVEHSMVGVTQEPEIDWVKNFRQYKGEFSGIIFEGGSNVETRMMYICGALVRNFVDARLVSLGSIVPLKDGKEPQIDPQEPTVLLVPNLYVKTQGGKPLTAWQVQVLYDALLARMTSGKQSVFFVESLESLANDFGIMFKEHLMAHYKMIGG
jgi:hypothetical protein